MNQYLRQATILVAMLNCYGAGTGCALDHADDQYGDQQDEPGEAVSGIVIDDHDFILLSQLEAANASPTGNQTDALYGRATGLVRNTGCTSFLVDDGVVATARHCRMDDDLIPDGTSPTTTIRFGRYGSGAPSGNFSGGSLDGLIRAIQLGIPLSVFLGNPAAFSSLTTWTCTVSQSTTGRDIEYYTCQPNVVSWVEPVNGMTVNLSLLPGHIWGHFNTASSGHQDGQSVRNFGVNQRCGDAVRSVITAPGEVEDDVDGCIGWFGGCFEVTTDTFGGHSGGPVVRRSDHVAYGVTHGSTFASWDAGETNDPCGSATGWHTENLATKIASDVSNFTGSSPTGGAQPTGGYLGIGGLVGGTGGTNRSLNCPANYLAAGVIGSTSSGGYLGNFGLVCMPNKDAFNAGMVGNVTSHRLDRAVVVAAGSHDTGFVTADDVDFNTYFNEVLSDTAAGPFQQALTMCPPGMFLRRITGFEGTYAAEVTKIACAPPATSWMLVERDVSGLGNLSDADDPNLVEDTTQCDGAGAFINGILIHSGWVTDGYRARCRASQ
jgi:hypothetical protein